VTVNSTNKFKPNPPRAKRGIAQRGIAQRATAKRDIVQGVTSAEALQSVPDQNLTVLTIGHSTRTIEEFLAMLAAHRVTRLVDVRSIPKSRRVPQFNSDALAASLEQHGIEYVHLKSLGGRRSAQKDSLNLGWRNASFRGYADHMASDEFRAGLARLLELAQEKHTAIMCAEAVPWRCHRSLIADALIARGDKVLDILDAATKPHALTSFAVVANGEVTYPTEEPTEQLQLPVDGG
jgi:hypothetical protein